MIIGDLTVEPILDGSIRAPAVAFYTTTTDEQWEPHRRFLQDDGMLQFDVGGFLVRAPGDRTLLVDAGLGPQSGTMRSGLGTFQGGELLNNLARHGVQNEDITDVLFTHLHFDHIGWAAQQGVITFPNATFRCDTHDWEHFQGNERVQPTLTAIEDRVKTWDGSGPLCPGIDVMSAPGHTPGSTIVVMSSGAARGLLLGDVVHCPVELLDEEWAGVGDVDPDLAKRTRNGLAREFEGSDTPMAAAHFPGLVFGRLLAAQGRRNWEIGRASCR